MRSGGCLGQAFSVIELMPPRRICRNDFVARGTEEVYDLLPMRPVPPPDDYFHILIFGFRCFRFRDDGIITAL